jgi:hypothetical protein
MPPVVQPTITPQTLLAILDLAPLDPTIGVSGQVLERLHAERDFVFFFGSSLNPHRQSRISFLLQDGKFQDWFKSLRSQTLVINGMDFASQPDEMVSPLSYMCTMLAKTVTQLQHAYPIVFFCRLHTDPDDKLHGASGMMRSLIVQLVLALADTADLSFLSNADMEAIQTRDVYVLCQLFDEILKRVSTAIVFCMIDGVSWFENEIHVQGMHTAMQSLNSLVEAVEATGSGLVFKLLVTSPIANEYCKYWFPNRVELTVPGEFSMDSQGFGNMRMLMASQNILNS